MVAPRPVRVRVSIVGTSTAEDARGKRFSLFIVCVESGGVRHVVFRPFRDFQGLATAAFERGVDLSAPFPRRTMEGGGPATEEFLEARRVALERWLGGLVGVCGSSPLEEAVRAFLWDGANTPPAGYEGPSVETLLGAGGGSLEVASAHVAPVSAPPRPAAAPATAGRAAGAAGSGPRPAEPPKLSDFEPIRGALVWLAERARSWRGNAPLGAPVARHGLPSYASPPLGAAQ
jgi:hypothetical protein